ncbi:hypothetical protein Q674_14065 [Acinetobacter sp. COS3]|uniref:Uncharacterized protein n=1 Tax=Acinetobacter venetianus TaxID=52133 RepID=A0A150HXU3_9GAMM|nr:hypothetical protein Q674_14065 [Acinetobacter sp. COS3]KXZ71930.1 hypothetical protein AVENLUH13518_00811 [Acinetobacter venetianus]KXZ72909.1 hypothetical protein AVENLUH5627_00932 [Acinetobacter venetianus]
MLYRISFADQQQERDKHIAKKMSVELVLQRFSYPLEDSLWT